MINNNSYVKKSNRNNNYILKVNDIKNINTNIINEEKKIIKRFSVKKDNSLSKKWIKNNCKIQYHIYYLNKTKQSSKNKLSSNYGNILNSNLKNKWENQLVSNI